MRPSEWYSDFLRNRQLSSSDGRPLYQYRMTDHEFETLQNSLRQHPLNVNSFQHWDVCFVLFSAKWWFRNYSGGPWKWEPIFEEVQNRTIGPTDRGELIKRGLATLKRKIHTKDVSSNNYLGTIVLEAGIPLETLDNSGWLRRFLKVIYREFAIQESNYVSLANSLVDQGLQLNIPETFRKPEFYEVVEDLIQKIYRLKKEHRLGTKENPLTYLDGAEPRWSESLPIPIDSPVGRTFFSGLLADIASIREPEPYPIEIDRVLRSNDNVWHIELSLTLPEQPIDFDDLRLSTESQERLKQIGKVSVELRAGTSFEKPLGVAYHARKGDRDLIQLPHVERLKIPITHTFERFELRLQHNGELIQTLLAGNELDTDLPLVFVERSDRILFTNQGSLKTSSSCAYAIVDDGFQPYSGNPIRVGNYAETSSVFKIEHPVEFVSKEGEKLSITVGSDERDEWKYELVGAELPSFVLSSQASAFIGKPRIYQTNKTSGQRIPFSGTIDFRAIGSEQLWQPFSDSLSGQGRIRLRALKGDLLYTRKVFLLPTGFDIRLKSSMDIKKGSIIIRQTGELNFMVVSTDVNSSIVTNGIQKEISLESTAGSPPEFVNIRATKILLDDLTLRLPFPCFGAQVFRSGTLLDRSDTIYSSALHGIRILLHAGDRPERFQLALRARGLGATTDYLQHHNVLGHIKEIALSGLKDEIDKLMAAQSDLDKHLVLEIKDSRGKVFVQNHIHQYAMTFKIEGCENGKATISTKATIPAGLKFLTYPFNNYNYSTTATSLVVEEPTTSHELALPGFPEGKPSCTWFVFPAADSSSIFRPFVILTGKKDHRQIDEIHSITDAALLGDPQSRIKALEKYLNELSHSFDHEDWREIAWQRNETTHLPMASLDIWSAFAKNHNALVSLFCQAGGEVVDSLTSEYPLLLEIVPVNCWTEGLKRYHNYLSIGYDDAVSRILIDSKLSEIRNRFELKCLEEILRNELLLGPQNSQPMNLLLMKLMIDKEYQQLIRSGIDPDTLPLFLASELANAVQKLPDEIKQIVPEVSSPKFKPLVYLPIILAYKSVHPEAYPVELIPTQVYRIRKIRRFKGDWFNTIYDYVQGYCWQIK
jgi:hypothetical protein